MSQTAGSAAVAAGTGDADRMRAWWVDAWRPSLREDSYEITRVEGEIPREIHGTLYRNGPSQKILPEQGYEALHLFDGDALVHAFRFDDGKAHYTGRFVESDCYKAEQAAGRYCMNGAGVQVEEPLEEFPIREQHNTNVVWHGDRLMAMVENSWPYQLDPRTLAPIGKTDLGATQLGMSVTAHPKIDGKTGQMVIHGYQPFEPYVQWYTIEPDGTCSLAEIVDDVPYASMMHDVAITENYIIFLLAPVIMDGEGLMSGKPFAQCVTWQPERGLKFGVKKREPGSPVQWFDSPDVGYIFHPGNAYEMGGKILMDACTYEDGGALLETLQTFRAGRTVEDWYARPYLYEMDLETGRCTSTRLDERAAEFPRLDDRLIGQRNRFGYALRGRNGDADQVWSVLVRYDREGGASSAHDFGRGCWPSEPVFVPRTPDAAEDDGFVLCTVYDGPNDASFLAVLDARNLQAEPLAKAHLEHRIPMGFHGNFAHGVV
ncbi:MAG: carotenoid oxygenase family protein [Candidatus Binatia bacterium]